MIDRYYEREMEKRVGVKERNEEEQTRLQKLKQKVFVGDSQEEQMWKSGREREGSLILNSRE